MGGGRAASPLAGADLVFDGAGAGALARAGEWARVFGGSDVTVPQGMLDQLTREASDALARARERLGAVALLAG